MNIKELIKKGENQHLEFKLGVDESLEYLDKHGRITTRLCADLLNISNDTALWELSKLKSLGIIEGKGVGKSIYYMRCK